MKADWKASEAARRVCDTLAAKHGVRSSESAKGAVAFALDCYARNRVYQELMPKEHAKRRRELSEPLQDAIAALKGFDCDNACQQAFGMAQRELWERLEHLCRLIEMPLVVDEERYRKPRHKPKMEQEDRLIMELAQVFSRDLEQPLETRLAKGQTGFNPAFVTMLEAAHDALSCKPCSNAREFVRRAKNNRERVVAKAPTYFPWPF